MRLWPTFGKESAGGMTGEPGGWFNLIISSLRWLRRVAECRPRKVVVFDDWRPGSVSGGWGGWERDHVGFHVGLWVETTFSGSQTMKEKSLDAALFFFFFFEPKVRR